MAEKTEIHWADSTINFWSGCTMVPAANGLKDSGCLHCYAKTRDDRHMIEAVSHWGNGAPRLKHVGAVRSAFAFNKKPWICEACGELTHDKKIDSSCVCGFGKHRRRVFSLSLGDWLDDEVPIEWLAEMLDTIQQCDQVTWILCSKRPENFFERIEEVYDTTKSGTLLNWTERWLDGTPPENIILLASVENQAMADKRIPELLKIPAACRGLSLEPLLGQVDLNKAGATYADADGAIGDSNPTLTRTFEVGKIDWAIIGCESGAKKRDCKIEWVENLVSQGKSAGVATFVKQILVNGKVSTNPNEWPEDLRVRQFPAFNQTEK